MIKRPDRPRHTTETQCVAAGARQVERAHRLTHYAACHRREWHKAIDKLHTIPAERHAETAQNKNYGTNPAISLKTKNRAPRLGAQLAPRGSHCVDESRGRDIRLCGRQASEPSDVLVSLS